MKTQFCWFAACLGVIFQSSMVRAEVDLSRATVVVEGEKLGVPAQVLVEEIATRTGLSLPMAEKPGDKGAISIRMAKTIDAIATEGFKITTTEGAAPSVTITASTRRGAMFGVGYLLRHSNWSKGKFALDAPINSTQKPEYAIRGHQLGYRAQANSYDAWDVKTFDKYIRELAFFGNNCVENIPFQDDRPTPIMPVSREAMNKAMSAICEKYDVDYWVWTPADFELKDETKRANAIKFHEAFYKECPRLDAIFFPGGDPGDNHPREVMPFLEDLSKILPKYHPKAKIWMSLQGFKGEAVDYFFDWLKEHKPRWLGGLVAGPGSPPLDKLRARLDKRYMLRDYPDITHVVRCQYPEMNLDQVWALTAGRESINPRPEFYAKVFAATAPHTDGFLSYSDGCHDDVNKAIYSLLSWDSKQKPRSMLVEYARCFFGGADAESIADGILEQEKNWDGALVSKKETKSSLERWQKLEKSHPELLNDWRWQMLLVRAYYDEYQRERLIRELALEQEAYKELEYTKGRYPTEAMEAAKKVLNKAVNEPVRPDLRNRLIALFDDLYKQIKFQSSVEKYHAIHPQRGCMLDFMDYPLNNRFWLEDQFHKVFVIPNLEGRWDALDKLRTWENPGPGSFYDDIGSLSRSPHAVRDPDPNEEAGSYWWHDSGMSRYRLSWQITGRPKSLEYTDLDPKADYVLRFCGFGDLKPRGDGETLTPTLYEKDMNTMKEFPVPKELVNDGKLSVTFDSVRLEGVNWRLQPRLAEAWLINVTEQKKATSSKAALEADGF